MSTEDSSYTSILLPGATIALFTKDAETQAVFEQLASDWRFARVNLEIHAGDVDTATQMYASAASPALVIVQTDDINNGFTEKLEALGANCAEGTSAIVIGPVNDVNLYRKLVGMGVSDYLVKPLKLEQLSNDIAATLIEQIGATGSRLIAVMGAKGGVGATAIAQALAWGASDQLAQKTFFLDAAGGWSSLSVGMNFEPSTTLAEGVRAAVEQKPDNLMRMVVKPSERLFILASGGDVMLEDNIDPGGYEALLEYLMTVYPVVIVDLSAAPAGLKRVTLSRAHKIMLVTMPVLPSVRAARTLLNEIKQLRGGADEVVDVIVNMQGFAPRNEVPKMQIEEGLERKPAAILPFDPGLFVRIESEAAKLHDSKPGEAIANMLLPLIKRVLADTGSEMPDGEETDTKKGGIADLLTKLKVK